MCIRDRSNSVYGGEWSCVGAGNLNKVWGDWSVIGGGYANKNYGHASVIGGGTSNFVHTKWRSVIGGGNANFVYSYAATVSGGTTNTIFGSYATVAGGDENRAFADYSTIAGGNENVAKGVKSLVAGGLENTALGAYSAVFGSYAKASSTNSATFGFTGSACASQGPETVNVCTSNGFFHNGHLVDETRLDSSNDIFNSTSVIVGGRLNTVDGEFSVLVGGRQSRIDNSDYATILAGYRSKVYSNFATVMGGNDNRATGRFASVLGGSKNFARGRYSVALGFEAEALGDRSLAMSFSPNGCTAKDDNTINMCGKAVYVNNFDVAKVAGFRRNLDDNRRSLGEVADGNVKRIAENDAVISENEKGLAALKAQLGEQMKVLMELQALVSSVDV